MSEVEDKSTGSGSGGYSTSTNSAPTLETQEENVTSGEQSNAASNSQLPPEASPGTNTPPPQPAKGSPGILAEDLGSGRKYGAMIYIQNRFDGQITAKTTNFYLQQMAIGLRERSQVLETFGVANVSFFGQTAKVYNFGGTCLDWTSQTSNSWEFFHASSFLKMYNNELRGSELVKKDQVAVLRVLNHTVYGYPLQINMQYDQNMDKIATFSMAMLVTKHLLALPGLVSDSQLETLYSSSKSVPLTDSAAQLMDNLQTVITACSTALSVGKDSEFYHPQLTNNSLMHKNPKQMVALIEEGSDIQTNFEALQTSLKEYLVTADGQISPFIAQVFGVNEDAIDTFFGSIVVWLDVQMINSAEDLFIGDFRTHLGVIKNFMDSLQSQMMAIQG